MQRTSLVIPTLNEAKNLPSVIKKVRKYVDEIIIVDGNSSDDTVKQAKRLKCKVLCDNRGKGSALIKGIGAAKGDYIITMDADWSHRSTELKSLINGLRQGYDICMGSRFLRGGGSDDLTPLRTLGNKIFVALVNDLFKAKYTDLCYGYRCFTKDAFKKLNLKSEGFSIETEISIKAAKHKLKVLEVPSFEQRRRFGKGKLKTFSDGFRILKMIVKEAII